MCILHPQNVCEIALRKCKDFVVFLYADNGIVRMQGCTLLQLCINYVKKVNEKTLIATEERVEL